MKIDIGQYLRVPTSKHRRSVRAESTGGLEPGGWVSDGLDRL